MCVRSKVFTKNYGHKNIVENDQNKEIKTSVWILQNSSCVIFVLYNPTQSPNNQ